MSKLLLLENGVEILSLLNQASSVIDGEERDSKLRATDILSGELTTDIRFLDDLFLELDGLKDRLDDILFKLEKDNVELFLAGRINKVARLMNIIDESVEDESDEFLAFFGTEATLEMIEDELVVKNIDKETLRENYAIFRSKVNSLWSSLEEVDFVTKELSVEILTPMIFANKYLF